MKIKTPSDLIDKIDADFSWRQMDIIRIRGLILNNQKEIVSSTYVRAAIPLIYAHWEGFVKVTSLYYVNYLTQIKLPFQDLNKSFILLHIKERILNLSISQLEKAEMLYNFFHIQIKEKSNLKSIPNAIDTQSNLKSNVLKEIITVLGLNYAPFEIYQKFIDDILLKHRNEIAHGNYNEVDFKTYDEIHSKTLILISEYKNQLQNAIISKSYFKVTPSAQLKEQIITTEEKRGVVTVTKYKKIYV